jgi:hypothetical protein
VFLMVIGAAGFLLCAGASAGVLYVRGLLTRGAAEVRLAADTVLDVVEQAVARVGPEIAGARARLAEQLTEEVFAGLRSDLRRMGGLLEHAARTADAAAGMVELMDRAEDNRVAIERLRSRAGELRGAARRLADLRLPEEARIRAGPILAAVESTLKEVQGSLAGFRLRVGGLRGRVDRLLDIGVILAVAVMVWMGLGQGCLFLTGRRILRRPAA